MYPFTVPAYGTVLTCPICTVPVSESTASVYHQQVASYTTPEATCRALLIELIKHQVPVPEDQEDWETVIGEHLCRKCRRCGYGWIERPADSRSVYTPTEE
jgi:hypothetical protein